MQSAKEVTAFLYCLEAATITDDNANVLYFLVSITQLHKYSEDVDILQERKKRNGQKGSRHRQD